MSKVLIWLAQTSTRAGLGIIFTTAGAYFSGQLTAPAAITALLPAIYALFASDKPVTNLVVLPASATPTIAKV